MFKMIPKSRWVIFFLIGFFLSALLVEAKLKVYSSIEVIEYFIERIGGELVDVEVLVGGGMCPESFSLRPAQLDGLSKASIYFSVGFGFEERLGEQLGGALKNLKIVDLREGLDLRKVGGFVDAGEGGCGHKNCKVVSKFVDKDPHIWMSPVMVMRQIETIREALVEKDPVNKIFYEKNYEVFLGELKELDEYLREALKSLKGENVYVYHPSYGYLADEYGFRQVPVEIGGKAPTPRRLQELIQSAKKEKIKVIFVESQSGDRSAWVIAREVGGKVVVLDVLKKDYLKNMYEIGRELERIFEGKGDEGEALRGREEN